MVEIYGRLQKGDLLLVSDVDLVGSHTEFTHYPWSRYTKGL